MTAHSLLRLDRPPTTAVHRSVSVAVAAITSLVTWAAARLTGDIDTSVRLDGSVFDIGAVQVLGASIAAGLLGCALLWILERRMGPGRPALRVWTLISSAVVLLSLIAPLTVDAPSSTRSWLVALHATAGVSFIASMRGGYRS